MKKKLLKRYTLYKSDGERRPGRKAVGARAAIAQRFKYLCQDAGLKVPEVAQALHVTERTVYAWISGQTAVPYSAYRLLRILNRFEFPDPAWAGWHMHSGKLWTPEGLGFDPADSAWWGLLVRKSAQFEVLFNDRLQLLARIAELRARLEEDELTSAGSVPPAGGEPQADAGRRAPSGLEVLVTPQDSFTGERSPARIRVPLDVASNTSKTGQFWRGAWVGQQTYRLAIGGAR